MSKRWALCTVSSWGVAGIVVAAGIYLLYCHSQSLRGRFERVRIGMSVKDAGAILGPKKELKFARDDYPMHAEIWSFSDGDLHCYNWDRRFKLYFLERDTPGWENEEASVYIDIDERGCVRQKTWLTYGKKHSNLLEYLRSWLS